MIQNQFQLLRTPRFLPLFITQFLGAFNDNVFKNALVILITYVAAEKAGLNPQLMVTAAAGVFILPFFLFSATAGQLADKHEKVSLIRIIKFIEILLMAGAVYGFYSESTSFLLVILFLMGTQSTFFGPIKYGILPEKLKEEELISGNALIEAGTFVAILVGTIIGGLLILSSFGVGLVSFLIIFVAIGGWISSFFIPTGLAADPSLRVDHNIFRETWKIVNYTRNHRDVFLSILGISWFWLVGATFLAQFPTYGKDIIGGNEQVVTLFLTIFTVGIGIGSLLCNKLLRGEIVATYVPLGILGMTLFTVDLYFASKYTFTSAPGELIGVFSFLSHLTSWRILGDLFLISICSGIYIVPLYAIMQARTELSHRSRTVASNNILNALFMVVSALGTSLMLIMDFSVTQVFLTIAFLNGFVAIYICKLLPTALIKTVFQWIFKTFYKIEIQGWENYKKVEKEKVVIVANHLSFLDPPLIASFISETLVFAVNTQIARNKWLIPFLRMAETFALDPTNPLATRTLIEKIKDGKKVVIFPEGRITVTGSLMKVYEGPGMVADKSGAKILPIRIDGAQYSPFSRMKGKVRIRLFPKITISFLEPQTFKLPENLKGKQRRQMAGSQLYDLMVKMIFQSSKVNQTLFESLLEAKSIHGSRHLIIEDTDRNPMSYFQVVLKSFVLGKIVSKISKPGEYLGILLPNSLGVIILFFSMQAFGRVPALLNFSVGKRNLLSACKTAQLKIVFTSRRFIELGKLEELEKAIKDNDIRLIYLEDLAKEIKITTKLSGLLGSLFPNIFYNFSDKIKDPEKPSVILFTSGSEGVPKGVVLSHLNIQANRCQASSRVDFGPSDIVFNALPIFHSFGLTGGTLLPILEGVKSFHYPSPLHYRIIPELCYDVDATIMFGTDTFLNGYSRYSHPYNFYSLRYVFAGAEKLKDETRRVWQDKFGIRILEGYGATETAPILSLNTKMHYKAGTVGRLLPDINFKLQEVPGIENGGRLLVSGPNIMLGYLLHDRPGQLIPPPDGWYDTGDIVNVDDEGFITIKGRVKRFAKIGGEMVSLTAVENNISQLWPGFPHAVVSIPDEKKGEQLILMTEYKEATREPIISHTQENGLGEINIPKTIKVVDKLPVLATGKIDYVQIQEMVEN